ncbi:hypothetical protein QQF64_005122 [Cirrhinus molitorella]|uniref:Uncharacterized protein n=1 Tax=Cirrhinus molitorella TaxID=172907 RepID=A0ABR3MI82_9TELE
MLTLKLTSILQLTGKTALISHSKTIFVCGAAHLYSFEAVSRAVTEAVGDGLAFEMKAEVVTGARRSFRDHRPDGETERVIQSFSPPRGRNTRDLALSLPDLKRWADPIYDLRAISWGPFQMHFNSSSSRHLFTLSTGVSLVKYCWCTERSGSSCYISGP